MRNKCFKRRGRSLTLLLALLLISSVGVAQDDWEFIRDKEGIKVYTRLNEGRSFKEFKSTMVINAELTSFLAVLQDVEALGDWGHNVKKVNLIRRSSDTLQVYYAEAKAPFPYKNRDGVYLNRFIWDKNSQTLVVEIEILDEAVDRDEELVRMSGYGSWIVSVLPDNTLNVIFQMQMDPGGSIPAWMANMFAGDSPYQTMKGMRKVINKKEYQGKQFPLLK